MNFQQMTKYRGGRRPIIVSIFPAKRSAPEDTSNSILRLERTVLLNEGTTDTLLIIHVSP